MPSESAKAPARGFLLGRLRFRPRWRSSSPAATRWRWTAHRVIESLMLDREAAHLEDELMPRRAHPIYSGFWFSRERDMLQALIDKSQRRVNGRSGSCAMASTCERFEGTTVRSIQIARRDRRVRRLGREL